MTRRTTPPAPAGAADTAAPPVVAARILEALWEAVRASDEHAAVETVLTALDAGADPESVVLDVIAPVQARVGSEWAADRMTVAQEHAATAINDRVVAAVSRHAARGARYGAGRVTVACVDGEWHALPARLLAEVLILRGWRVDFLGAQVPVRHLVAHLHHSAPDAVALSSSIPTRLPAAHAAITACQAVGVPVLAGGAAFGPDGRYARLLGADAWAADARGAARRLRDGLPRPPSSQHRPTDDLPHLADHEYTRVVRARSRLVRDTLAGLEERIPAVRAYSEQQRQHTAEDLAHIVDFLATSLYTDDPEILTGFLTWTVAVLAARGVPAGSLHSALDLLAGQLPGFPRASRMIADGRRALREAAAAQGQ